MHLSTPFPNHPGGVESPIAHCRPRLSARPIQPLILPSIRPLMQPYLALYHTLNQPYLARYHTLIQPYLTPYSTPIPRWCGRLFPPSSSSPLSATYPASYPTFYLPPCPALSSPLPHPYPAVSNPLPHSYPGVSSPLPHPYSAVSNPLFNAHIQVVWKALSPIVVLASQRGGGVASECYGALPALAQVDPSPLASYR